MPLSRRAFLGGVVTLPAAAVAAGTLSEGAPVKPARAAQAPPDWAAMRALFDLDPQKHHLAAFVLAPHSRPVREAIERHRRGLDRDYGYFLANDNLEAVVADAAARHLGTSARLVALTDSTTMGLGLLYGGLRLRRGDEVLTTSHDHYATHASVRLAARRSGARVRTVSLYPARAPERATVRGLLRALEDGITRRTRVVAITWVHSSSGIRLPLADVAELVARANRGRRRRILLVVDGAHALGTGPIDVEALGVDALVAGCHKWLLGPRGTGIAWARATTWRQVAATIPTFSGDETPGRRMTPGGYHSFEHRWALAEAFALQDAVGPARIAGRIAELSGALRDGLSQIRGVTVHAPREARLTSGVVCCTVGGRRPADVVDALREQDRVSASVTPYAVELVRFGTLPITTPAEVDAAVRAVARLG